MSESVKNVFLGYNLNNRQLSIDDYICLDSLKNRAFFVTGEINSCTVDSLVPWIIRFNQEDIHLPIEKRAPIVIYISSPGGSVFDGFTVINAIEHSKTPVWTVNIGYCFSMAFHLLITGHQRFAYKNAVFLHHDGMNSVLDSALKLQDYANFDREYRKRIIMENVINHTKISKKEFLAKERREWYMFSEEALDKGVIDHIIDDDTPIRELVV